jgi:hypothetical protein
MKVFSLYYKETFVVAFPNREDAIDYGKKYYDEYAWQCNILEEYLSKTPLVYTPPHYTSLHSIPCKTILDTGITQTFDKPVEYNKGVQAETDKPIPGGWI